MRACVCACVHGCPVEGGKVQGGGGSTARPDARVRERARRLREPALPPVGAGSVRVPGGWVDVSPCLRSSLSPVVLLQRPIGCYLRDKKVMKLLKAAVTPSPHGSADHARDRAGARGARNARVSSLSLRPHRAAPWAAPAPVTGRARSRPPAARTPPRLPRRLWGTL